MFRERVTIFMPSQDRNGLPLPAADRQAVLRWLLHEMARNFGGATALSAVGAYVTGSGMPILEPVTAVTSYFSSSGDDVQRWLGLALTLKERTNQESVAVETSEGLELV